MYVKSAGGDYIDIRNIDIEVSATKVNYNDNYNYVITGSAKADKITLGGGKSVINTGNGKDVITAGGGQNTVNITGTGLKTINFKKDITGTTTINNSVFAPVKLAFDNFSRVEYLREGSDLILCYHSTNKEDEAEEVVLKAYFENVNKEITINGYKLEEVLKVKPIKVKGVSSFEDTSDNVYDISCTDGNDTIKVGSGVGNTIKTFDGDDITLGEGSTTVNINGDGNKTITINKSNSDETETKNTIELTGTTATVDVKTDSSELNYSREEENLKIENENGDIIEVTDYWTYPNQSDNFKINGSEIKGSSDIINYTPENNSVVLNDGYNYNVTGSNEADTITTGNRTDIITPGKGDDTVNFGKGNKTLNLSKGDGNDNITIKDDGTNLNIVFDESDITLITIIIPEEILMMTL